MSDITTEQMLETIDRMSRLCERECRGVSMADWEAIRIRLTEYDTLKDRYLTATDNLKAREAEVCELTMEADHQRDIAIGFGERIKMLEREREADKQIAEKLATEVNNLRAEVERLDGAYKWLCKTNDDLVKMREKAEAELERARPLLEAAEKVDKEIANRIIKHPFYSISESLEGTIHQQEEALDALIAALAYRNKEEVNGR